jgi:hypothetical protein
MLKEAAINVTFNFPYNFGLCNGDVLFRPIIDAVDEGLLYSKTLHFNIHGYVLCCSWSTGASIRLLQGSYSQNRMNIT